MSDRSGTKRRATYDDLLKVPEPMVAEIVDGELYASPRPAPRHSVAASVLLADLKGPFQAHAWLVNPLVRTLEILRLEGERWVVAASQGDQETVRAEPFAAVAVELPAVWGE
ncbi:MAG TPA: hypothetical protein VMT87_11675 [Vicinamibacteria bacterium]|nr:hypothetical protein [Vicinamibacteria bacterium]